MRIHSLLLDLDKKPSFCRKLKYKFYDLIDSVYQYSWLYRIRWKITHWLRSDNWVKTHLPVDYYDKPCLMESALFSLVSDYVARDREDAFSVVSYDHSEEHIEAKNKIISILHFYHIEKPELEKKESSLLHEAYGDTELVFTEEKSSSGNKLVEFKYNGVKSEKELDDIRDELRKTEELIDKRTQEMLKVCIDVRPYLWT
jgi:hypothetical protein